MAVLYFGKRILKDYKYSYKLPTAIFFTIYIVAFPAAFAFYSAVIDFTVVKAVVFVVLLAFTIYNGLTWQTKKPSNPNLGDYMVTGVKRRRTWENFLFFFFFQLTVPL